MIINKSRYDNEVYGNSDSDADDVIDDVVDNNDNK